MNQININELEQKSMERQRQASIDLMNSRKKKYVKNGFNKAAALAAVHLNNNGSTSNANNASAAYDVSTANQAASYYPFYASSPNTKYYSTSPPQIQQQPTSSSSGLYSPSRMSPYRNNFSSNSYMNVSKSMIRNLRTSFDSIGAVHEPAYSQVAGPDRFHWMNKSIVKA